MTKKSVNRGRARSLAGEFLAYLTVSAIALAVDLAVLYVLAVPLAFDKPLAALIAYCVGFIVHYALAVSHVFDYRRFAQRRTVELTIYALAGVAGAAASYAIVLAGTTLGASLWSSKAVAVAVSFVIAYSLRRYFLFSRARPTGA
jgi:putative flippase GtrA